MSLSRHVRLSDRFGDTVRERWGVNAFVEVWFEIRDKAAKGWPNHTDLHFMLREETLRFDHWWEERALMLVVEARLQRDGTVDLIALDAYELPESPADLDPDGG